jgi:hypothetical protein
MAEVILEVLDSWSRLGKLLLSIVFIFGIACLAVYAVIKLFPSSRSELQIGVGNSHILLQQSTPDGANYVLLVSPEGWVRTSIWLRAGQNLEVQAGGRVNIDFAGLMRALEARKAAEDRVRRIKGNDVAWEDYFTDQEKAATVPNWRWSDPDGRSDRETSPEETMKPANKAHRAMSIMPSLPYGVLIGALTDEDAEPDRSLALRLRSTAFRVGSRYCKPAPSDGYLYFIVNDVQSNRVPDLFFVDNIGAFYVKVEVNAKCAP